MKLLKYGDYKDKVEKIFKQVSEEIKLIIPNARVEHIGSSSIPGSLSKGDLDIFLGVPQDFHKETIKAIKTIGFIEKQDTFSSEDLCMLITDRFNYDVAIQVVSNGSQFESFIIFRDRLRQDEQLVLEYNEVKEAASLLSEQDYRGCKAGFIGKVLKQHED